VMVSLVLLLMLSGVRNRESSEVRQQPAHA
jgi:hypothetical protein